MANERFKLLGHHDGYLGDHNRYQQTFFLSCSILNLRYDIFSFKTGTLVKVKIENFIFIGSNPCRFRNVRFVDITSRYSTEKT